MHLPVFTQRILLALAVTTVFGILVHDTKIDKAAALALTVPLGLSLGMSAVPSLHSEGHTHIEKGAYGKTTVMGMPRIQPRDDHKKYQLSKRMSNGDDFFGGSRLMWPSI